MFDDSQQKLKMQKPATAFNHSKLPPIVMKGPGQDLRRLSAQNWRKQRKQVLMISHRTVLSFLHKKMSRYFRRS